MNRNSILFMRNVFAFILVFSSLAQAGGLAYAQSMSVPVLTETTIQKRDSQLTKLFAELKREDNETHAKRLADRIMAEWSTSGSATTDLMMRWADAAVEAKNYPMALDFLDQVIVMQPDYAEGWNRRATLYFLMNDYRRSMADIQRTLTLEPRHFGALMGLGAILKEVGRKERAMEAYERALAVYPMLREAQKQVGEIADELAGHRI
ncbi:MAG: tetratricopeptide repeat protein [Phyllobacterium sp.]